MTKLGQNRGNIEDLDRFEGLKRKCEKILGQASSRRLKVLDVGCGYGAQAGLWARAGHLVVGLDIDFGCLRQAQGTTTDATADIVWARGDVCRLPLKDRSVDVCLVVELLEHVPEWEKCLESLDQTLRTGGLLLLTTTNVLCPRQSEFRLPLYSWWPRYLKSAVLHFTQTGYPRLANYSRYPAVNWFNYFGLCDYLSSRGYDVYDRFDMLDAQQRSRVTGSLIRLVRRWFAARALAYLFVPGLIIYAVKR